MELTPWRWLSALFGEDKNHLDIPFHSLDGGNSNISSPNPFEDLDIRVTVRNGSSDIINVLSRYLYYLGEEAPEIEISGFEFTLGPWEEKVITAEVIISEKGFKMSLSVPLSLRLFPPLFNRVDKSNLQIVSDSPEVNVSLGKPEITFQIEIDENGEWNAGLDFDFHGEKISIDPFMIGNTGVIIEAEEIAFNFSGNGLRPENAPDDWKGIYIGNANIYIPNVISGSIRAEGLGIGSGGFYGRIEYESPLTYDAEKKEFPGDENLGGEVLGMKGGISSIALEFYQNSPVKAEIKGKILLPFFDEPIDVSIGIDADGNFHVTLADTNEDGIYILRKENILEAKIETICFGKKEDLFIVSLSGSIRPLVGDDVKWPEFEVEKLSIDSKGNVHIDGGWIDIPDKVSFDFHGFTMEVTHVGFGSDEDQDGRYRWIGFSGEIKLVEGLKAGGSVEGLRIKWWDNGETGVDLKGVGVNFEIPEVLKFDGEVAFLCDGVEGFKGDINLNLMTIGLEMDAALIVGKRTLSDGEFKFFYIYMNVELPAGIPLGCSGVGLYGMAGLFAYNMEPDKKRDEAWYGEDTNGWYKKEEEGVTSTEKWDNKKNALALGGGITLGTIADNGYMVSAKTLLVIVIPGPIILIEGRASFLKRRTALSDSDEGLFKALAVIDNRAGKLLVNIEATYKFDKEGRVVDIHGGAEAFFDYRNMNNWHLYLGENEPRDKRIRAEILKLFGAETYFMLEPTQLAWGFWFGFDERWKFGPVRIVAAAWTEGGVLASWKPEHFWGKVWLHGELGVKVFWFNFGFYLDAGIEGNTPAPYYIRTAFKVGINLPWPFKDFKIRIDLKWLSGGEPPWVKPLKEVAIGHEIVQENIVLLRNVDESEKELLKPNREENCDGFIDTYPCEEPEPPAEKSIHVVPLDSRLILTFGKPVWDTACAGLNSYPLEPEWQKIGHRGKDESLKDYQYKFELTEILLQKESGNVWSTVAGTGAGSYSPIYGTWLPVEDGKGNPNQTKLQLWTKTPFSYTRYSTRDYEDGFTEDNPDYPCVPDYSAEKICVKFDDLPLGTYGRELEHHGIQFKAHEKFSVVEASKCYRMPDELIPGNALRITGLWSNTFNPPVFIILPDSVCWVSIDLSTTDPAVIKFLDLDGNTIETKELEGSGRYDIEFESGQYIGLQNESCLDGKKNAKYLSIEGISAHESTLCFFKICYITVSEREKESKYRRYRRRTQTMLAHWYHEGNILEPYTKYRLEITTNAIRKCNGTETINPISEYAFFRTEGPPGFVELEGKNIPPPENTGDIPHENPLSRLDFYVRNTIPKNGQYPFYRAYDMGMGFNKDYVELMYKIAKHDLGIYLFDNDGQPVRDAFGRIIAFCNVWGKAEEIELTEEEEIYVGLTKGALCMDFDRDSIPPKDILGNSAGERFLLPQKLYEARTIPMLFHETFESKSTEEWTFVDEGNVGSSSWKVSSDTDDSSVHYLGQTVRVYTRDDCNSNEVACRGTYALYDKGDWTDYRLTVVYASGIDGAIGVMFGYQDQYNYYRFSMDRGQKYRRLIKMKSGKAQPLAEDEWIYKEDRTYIVAIETIGNSIRVFMDGELIFDVIDEKSLQNNKIALYCRDNKDARFYEVVVEDLSEKAKIVYNFQFSSSRYANFFHHIHSFNDRIWTVELPADSNLDGEKFEEKWPDYIRLPQQVEIALIKKDDQDIGFLLKSPEPIEWQRVALEVMKSDILAHLAMPGAVKLTSYEKSSNEQWVDLVIREDTPLFDWKIEYAEDPQNPQWKPFYTFKGFKLFLKTVFSDEDFTSLPSSEGSYFIDGDTAWKNYRVTADFGLYGDYQEAGILFGYKDEKNYYRLAVSNKGGMKLLKNVNNNITILWPPIDVGTDRFFELRDDLMTRLEKKLSKGPEPGSKKRYRITVEVNGSKIAVFLNGEQYFEIDDSENNIDHGCIGAFFLPEARVEFRELSVISCERKSFCSGQLIRVYNPVRKQGVSFENILVFNTERLIPELMGSSDIAFRIFDENSTTIHQRTFLPDEEFVEAGNFPVVPSADGTAALILPEGTNYIEENKLYRFEFRFFRKREGLPVLKQWGLDTVEEVNIEFRCTDCINERAKQKHVKKEKGGLTNEHNH